MSDPVSGRNRPLPGQQLECMCPRTGLMTANDSSQALGLPGKLTISVSAADAADGAGKHGSWA